MDAEDTDPGETETEERPHVVQPGPGTTSGGDGGAYERSKHAHHEEHETTEGRSHAPDADQPRPDR
jgi:hypothetical protein